MDTNTEKVILCWVLVNQSVPVGHTILTLDWKEQGRGREAGDKKNWNRKKNMAGFIPKVVVESLSVCVCVCDEKDPFYSGCNGSSLTVSLTKVPEGKKTL